MVTVTQLLHFNAWFPGAEYTPENYDNFKNALKDSIIQTRHILYDWAGHDKYTVDQIEKTEKELCNYEKIYFNSEKQI